MDGLILALWMAALMLVITVPFLGRSIMSSKGEAREAVFVLRILEDGPWAAPVVHNTFFHHKPPMFNWLAALTSIASGTISEWTIRLPSAIFAAATVFVTCFLASAVAGRRAAVIASLLLIASPRFFSSATDARVDMVLCFFLVASFYLLYRAIRDEEGGGRWMLYLCMALGALTKGPVAIALPVGVALVLAVVMRSRTPLKVFISVPGLLILVVLPLLWLIPATRDTHGALLDILIQENFGRFLGVQGAGASHVKPFYFYLPQFAGGFFPWIVFLPIAIWHAWRTARGERRLVMWLPLVAFAVCFVFYSISSGKRGVYLLPCYPFAAVMVAQLLAGARSAAVRGTVARRATAIAAVASLSVAASAAAAMAVVIFWPGLLSRADFVLDRFVEQASKWVSTVPGWHEQLSHAGLVLDRFVKRMSEWVAAVPGPAATASGLCVAVVCLVGGTIAFARNRRLGIPVAAGGVMLLMVLYNTSFHPVLARLEAERTLVDDSVAIGISAPLYHLDKIDYAFCLYYALAHREHRLDASGLPETPLLDEAALVKILDKGEPIFVLMRDREHERLQPDTARRLSIVKKGRVLRKGQSYWMVLSNSRRLETKDERVYTCQLEDARSS